MPATRQSSSSSTVMPTAGDPSPASFPKEWEGMADDGRPARATMSVMPSNHGRIQRWLGGMVAVAVAAGCLWKAAQLGRQQGYLNDVRAGNAANVQAFLAAGGEPAVRDFQGKNAIDLAAARGDESLVNTLLRAGVPVTQPALNDAAVHGRSALLATLLSGYGVDRLSDEDKGELLCSAAQSGDMDTVKLLLKLKAPLETKNVRDDSMTPLMYAARSSKPGVVYTLMAAGADKTARTDKGVTVLMLAAAWNAPVTVQFLLKSGAKVNETDNAGNTALMLAANVGNVATCDMLIGYGASVNAKNAAGKSVIDWALEGGTPRVIALLQRHGAHP